jgi:hypothetical protein
VQDVIPAAAIAHRCYTRKQVRSAVYQSCLPQGPVRLRGEFIVGKAAVAAEDQVDVSVDETGEHAGQGELMCRQVSRRRAATTLHPHDHAIFYHDDRIRPRRSIAPVYEQICTDAV